MRILLVNYTAYPHIGGVENSLRFIGKELLQAGHQVKIFCFQISPNEPLRQEHEGIEIVRCDKYMPSRWPSTNLKRFVNLTRLHIPPLLEEFRPDVVWSRYAPAGLGVALSGFEGKLVHIFPTTACMDTLGIFVAKASSSPLRRLKRLLFWPWAYKASSHIDRELLKHCQPIVFSENMQRQLQRSYGVLAEKTRVIRPGVDANFFSPENGRRLFTKIEKAYNLHPHEPYVLYVGRLSSAKNIPLLIDAMGFLRRSVQLVLVGAGAEQKRLSLYAKKRRLMDRVIFVGEQYKLLPGFYAMAKVCVLPSVIESFGQTYLEAMACGTPVIGFATDGRRVITATNEIIQDNKTGRIVRQVTAQALANGIKDILALSTGEYQAMSERTVADVVQRFSWKHFVKELLAI